MLSTTTTPTSAPSVLLLPPPSTRHRPRHAFINPFSPSNFRPRVKTSSSSNTSTTNVVPSSPTVPRFSSSAFYGLGLSSLRRRAMHSSSVLAMQAADASSVIQISDSGELISSVETLISSVTDGTLPIDTLVSATTTTATDISSAVPIDAVPISVPIPDDTAVDMLSFALSGPGVIAVFALVSLGLVLFFSFAELGPIVTGRSETRLVRPFLLHVNVVELNTRMTVELPDGTVTDITYGSERIFRFESQQAADAVAKRLQQYGDDLQYTLFKLDGIAVKTLAQWPRSFNAEGAKWPEGTQNSDVDIQQRWDEYEQIDSFDQVDEQWKNFVKSLGSVRREDEGSVNDGKGPCRLCGGSGFTRCYRCGGIPGIKVNNGRTECDCQNGKRLCEWCSGG